MKFWRMLPPATRVLVLMCVIGMAMIAGLAVGIGKDLPPHPAGRSVPPPALRHSFAPLKPPGGVAFESIVSRPIFHSTRRPTPQQPDEAEVPFDYQLVGVVLAKRLQMAVIRSGDSRSVHVGLGEPVKGAEKWKLSRLKSRSAIFASGEEERELKLITHDGRSGESPTAVSTARTAHEAKQPEVEVARAADAPSDTPAPKDGTAASRSTSDEIRQRVEQRRASIRARATLRSSTR